MRRSGQMALMEQIITLFFVMVIIVFIIFFLVTWQVSRSNAEKEKIEEMRGLSILKTLISSNYLVKENSMFDDSKLTSMLGKEDELKEIFGDGWFAEIRVMDGRDETVPCTANEYDNNCNYWEYLKKKNGNYTAYVVPVNIYRKDRQIS